jgi:hypothetical protein
VIFDVLDELNTLVRHATKGINAQIAVVNTAKSTEAPDCDDFLIWDLSKLPTQMNLPSFQMLWERSFDLEPSGQGKWRGNHTITFQYWTKETDSEQARKDVAITAAAYRKVVDLIPSECSTVDVVNDQSILVSGWAVAGKVYTWMGYTFTVKERDENP